MLNRIFELSLGNRFLVLVFAALLVAIGIYSMRRLPIDAVPDVTPNQVQILTNAPGLGPVEVEKFITFPVETAMSGLPGIEKIRSVSRFGLSAVTVYFDERMDIYFCRRLVMERMPAAREAIPTGLGNPEMGPISTGLGEIYQFEVGGAEYFAHGAALDPRVGHRLQAQVGARSRRGEHLRRRAEDVRGAARSEQAVSYGLSIDQVFDALEGNNANAGGGYIEHAQEQYLVRGEGLIGDLATSRTSSSRPATTARRSTSATSAKSPSRRWCGRGR